MPDLLAVFGNPVLHSKSPLMFNALLGDKGFYTRVRTNSAEDLALAIRSLNLKGANITAPYKEDILPFVDKVSEEVRIIGGANTIANSGGYLKAFNTDWYGATQAILRSGLSLKGLRVALLGLGGAGKAVAYGLVKEGAEVTVVNRTPAKAQEIAAKLGCSYALYEMLPELLKRTELFVSAILPDILPDALKNMPADMAVFDANYHASPLVELARHRGNRTIDASQWLLLQAVKSHEYYLHSLPNEEVMCNALKQQVSSDVKVIGICSECTVTKEDQLTIVPIDSAVQHIETTHPDLVIFTPQLTINEVKEIYSHERSKAFGR